jgi:hypothetical protein
MRINPVVTPEVEFRFMLRRRVEKLELKLPLATGDLIERWERQAMASLSMRSRIWCWKSPNAAARLAAMQSFHHALCAAIVDVSDADLERMIVILDPGHDKRPRVAEATE